MALSFRRPVDSGPHPFLGLGALLGGVVLFSTIEVAAKVIGRRVLPFEMVFIRFFLTGLILLALAVPAWRRRPEPLAWRDYGIFALNGLIGIGLSISLFHLAILVFAKAASCAVVFSANPIFVMVLARFINREPWTRRKGGALAFGVTGVACFAWESGAFTAQSLAALGVMLASAFFFALSICISKRVISRYGVFLYMGFTALFGSLMALPLALVSLARTGAGGIVAAWPAVAYIALAGTAVAYALYYSGLRQRSTFQASMVFFLKPVLASLLAVAWLGERLNGFMIAGSLLILGGLGLALVWPRANQ